MTYIVKAICEDKTWKLFWDGKTWSGDINKAHIFSSLDKVLIFVSYAIKEVKLPGNKWNFYVGIKHIVPQESWPLTTSNNTACN